MDEAPDQTTGESPYLKLPWLAVAAGLAIMLLVVLGIGVYANRYLRQPTAITGPTPTNVVLAVAVSTVLAVTPQVPATEAAVPRATGTVAPPTQTPIPPPTPSATPLPPR